MLSAEMLSSTVTLLILASIGWLAMAFYVVRHPGMHGRLRMVLLGMAVAGIGIALPFTDVMSDDALRYRWDGHVVAHDVNPYAAAPNDPSMQRLAIRDSAHGIDYPADVTYPHIRTIYPPGMQLAVGLVSGTAGIDVMAWRLTWSALCLTLIGIALWSLWHDVHRSTLLLLALTNPSLLLHGIADVHADMLMALLALLGCIALDRRARVAGGLLLGAAITVKYVAVIMLPFMLLRMDRHDRLYVVGAAIAAIAVITAPFASTSMFDAFRSFASTWQSNALLYTLLKDIIVEPTIRYVLAGIGALMGAVVVWRRRDTPVAAGILAIIALFIVSPVVHAWYILIPLLMAPFAPLRSSMVWGATISLYGLAYIAYKGDGVWREHTVPLVLQFIPVMVAWTLDVRRGPISASEPDV
jgi:hypothetical protein